MKQIIKNSPLALAIFIIGAAILVGGILTMALHHDMSWQSYVIIGVLMLSAIWAMINMPVSVSVRPKEVPVRHHER
ncbi:MAG: hypothetical protein J1E82_03075 [Muribaculaceae bacterium]|nr:hypothetical protein [Muribaculaceae bacterium]